MLRKLAAMIMTVSLIALSSCARSPDAGNGATEERKDSEKLDPRLTIDLDAVDVDRLYSDIDDTVLANYKRVEGNTHENPLRERCLGELATDEGVQRIAEIGFNAGHSAVTFLYHNRSARLWSFDLCEHPYSEACAEYIKGVFGDRFTLICGDSRETVPRFFVDNPEMRFDLIHIDGGHVASIPTEDVMNMLDLSHGRTIFIADDCNENRPNAGGGFAGREVNVAWRFAVKYRILEPLEVGDSCNVGNCVGRPLPGAMHPFRPQ